MGELKSIMEKFVASGWDLISQGLIPRRLLRKKLFCKVKIWYNSKKGKGKVVDEWVQTQITQCISANVSFCMSGKV